MIMTYFVPEMEQLETLLKENDIPFVVSFDDWINPDDGRKYWYKQLIYPNNHEMDSQDMAGVMHKNEKRISDVICQPGSFGYSEGLLEQLGLTDYYDCEDRVLGYLTAEQVFQCWKHHYETRKEKKNESE